MLEAFLSNSSLGKLKQEKHVGLITMVILVYSSEEHVYVFPMAKLHCQIMFIKVCS